VCNSGVGLTGLALLTENPQLTDIVAESYNRINSMLNELGVDGGWQEGGGYWNYGVHTSTFFADALKRITNSKYNLFENERLQNNPTTFPIYIALPGNKSLNFEDSGGGRVIGSPHLINKLATETNNAEAAWYRQEFFDAGNDIFDIIWPRPQIEARPPENLSKHFRTIDWWVMRSDFKDPGKVIVAGKAGMNDDPHHGHLNIGHFVVYWQNEYFIQDLGSRGYDEKFFDDMRWDYPQASSVGHNVVFVNGEKQIPAKMRKQPWKKGIGGKVEQFESNTVRDYVRMDPTNAYPKNELKGWKRHILLEKPEITLVLDEVTAEPGSEIEIRFHPGVPFEIIEDFVFLKGGNGNLALIPLVNENSNIRAGKHAHQSINATFQFSWIDYFDTEVISKEENTTIASIILPVKDKVEAKQIANSKSINFDASGNLSVSVMKKGVKHTFNFENKNGTLILKNN
jgi:hypothetical protein